MRRRLTGSGAFRRDRRRPGPQMCWTERVGLRAFGEMVDVLNADDNLVGALQLEELWTQLQRTVRFQLLCGYQSSSLAPDDSGTGAKRPTTINSSDQGRAPNCRMGAPSCVGARGPALHLHDGGDVFSCLPPSPGARSSLRRRRSPSTCDAVGNIDESRGGHTGGRCSSNSVCRPATWPRSEAADARGWSAIRVWRHRHSSPVTTTDTSKGLATNPVRQHLRTPSAQQGTQDGPAPSGEIANPRRLAAKDVPAAANRSARRHRPGRSSLRIRACRPASQPSGGAERVKVVDGTMRVDRGWRRGLSHRNPGRRLHRRGLVARAISDSQRGGTRSPGGRRRRRSRSR